MTTDCDCSEDWGPCEAHLEVLIQRAGSSNRTGDDLAATFIEDVEDLRPDVRPWDAGMSDAVDLAAEYREACPGGEWAPPAEDDGYSMGEALSDAIPAAESALGDLGLSVFWDDGYIIGRITGGPLQ